MHYKTKEGEKQGIYEDEFVKTEDGWKIKVRKLTTDN